jgi:hypothetical protein
MDVRVDRAKRPQQQPPERDTRRRDDPRLEAPVTADPAKLDRGRASLQRPSYGESRVYMSPRTPAHYQQSH